MGRKLKMIQRDGAEIEDVDNSRERLRREIAEGLRKPNFKSKMVND